MIKIWTKLYKRANKHNKVAEKKSLCSVNGSYKSKIIW